MSQKKTQNLLIFCGVFISTSANACVRKYQIFEQFVKKREGDMEVLQIRLSRTITSGAFSETRARSGCSEPQFCHDSNADNCCIFLWHSWPDHGQFRSNSRSQRDPLDFSIRKYRVGQNGATIKRSNFFKRENAKKRDEHENVKKVLTYILYFSAQYWRKPQWHSVTFILISDRYGEPLTLRCGGGC